MGRWGAVLGLTLVLGGCGGSGPAWHGLTPVLTEVRAPTFAGGAGTITLTLPPAGPLGLPVVVAATTVGTDGTVVPTTVTQTGDQLTVSAQFPPNLTAQARTYTVTLTLREGTQMLTTTHQVVVPGLDAPAVTGPEPPTFRAARE